MNQILFKQPVSGVVLLDKPLKLTSNTAMQRVKRLFGASKAGHTGSLDPLATGMLPICLGDATIFSQYLLDADKCYTVTAYLGAKTTTGDTEGDVITDFVKSRSLVTKADLQAILPQFTGSIAQVPSMYSALKHEGKPLYALARKGVVIERPARTITIHSLELLSFNFPKMTLRVTCSKGTYIRNLVEDIGDALGIGAHVLALHRNWVEGLSDFPMLTLEKLSELADEPMNMNKHLHRSDILLMSIAGKLCVTKQEMIMLYQGKKIACASLAYQEATLTEHTRIRLYDELQQYIGLGRIIDNCLQVLRLMPGHPTLMM